MNWHVITRQQGPALGALFGLVCLAATVQAGCLHRLIYYGIPGLQVEDLTSAWQYPDFPDEAQVLQDFIQGGTNIGDQFGSLMEGFLEAPETGFYTFWMHSDDFGELWLAPDSDPAHVVRIARVPGWSNTGEWERYRAQKSAPIRLVRGAKYFLRVLQKEDWGGDNVGVGWQRPDGTLEQPTPALYVQPYIRTAATLAIARQPGNASTRENQPVTLSVDLAPWNQAASFQWYLESAPISDAVLSSLTYTPTLSDNGKRIRLKINNTLESAPAVLTVTADRTRPTVVAVDPLGYDRLVELRFSEAMEASRATNRTNYRLDGGAVAIRSAELLPGGTLVRLRTAPFAWGQTHRVVVSNLTDIAAAGNLLEGNSWSFWAGGTTPRPLVIQAQPQDVSVSAYHDAVFTAEVSGQPGSGAVQWFREGDPSPISGSSPDGLTLLISMVSMSDDGAQFHAVASNLVDTVVTRAARLTVVPDTEPPGLLSAAGTEAMNQVRLTFSERMDPATANDATCYTIPGLSVQSAALQSNLCQVLLTTSRQEPGTEYKVKAEGLRDLSGNQVPMGSQAAFYSWVFRSGAVFIEWYFAEGGGWTLEDLGDYAAHYPPTFTSEAAAMETPSWENGSWYGARMQGIVVPPETGEYVFAICSDDHSQFQLSTDASPEHLAAAPLCWVEGWSHQHDWYKYPSQLSAPIGLTAGVPCYFRVLQFEWDGGDGFSVAWQRPSGGFEVIPAKYLGLYVQPSNSPPVLQPVGDRIARIGQELAFTCPATDPDIPAQALTFRLGAGAPAKAVVGATDGVFAWRPAVADAGTTSLVEVIVTDNGVPRLSATQSFQVRVPDMVSLQIDRTVVAASASGCAPVTLFTTAGLTNVQFVLTHQGHLANLAFVLPPTVGVASLQSATSSNAQFRIVPLAGQVFRGALALGSICFSAAADQPSGFQTLPAPEVWAVRANGEPLTDCRTQPVRVGVMAGEPLLEMLEDSSGRPALLLYGEAGTRYLVQSTVDLGAAAPWQKAWEGVLSGCPQVVEPLDTSAPARYYRAVEP